MADILVDSNILLDVIVQDPHWCEWSYAMLAKYGEKHTLIINPIIYAEISLEFETIEELDEVLAESLIKCRQIPYEAGFLAGRCFLKYRKSGGQKRSPLPDFFIGAHAAIENVALMTRDRARYETYFPSLRLITPLREADGK